MSSCTSRLAARTPSCNAQRAATLPTGRWRHSSADPRPPVPRRRSRRLPRRNAPPSTSLPRSSGSEGQDCQGCPDDGRRSPGCRFRDRFVFAVVRGDMEVSENKLAGTLRTRCAGYASETIRLRPATEEEIRTAGAVPATPRPWAFRPRPRHRRRGSSPVAKSRCRRERRRLSPAEHQYPRDYQPTLICDIAAAQEGDGCARCGTLLS